MDGRIEGMKYVTVSMPVNYPEGTSNNLQKEV